MDLKQPESNQRIACKISGDNRWSSTVIRVVQSESAWHVLEAKPRLFCLHNWSASPKRPDQAEHLVIGGEAIWSSWVFVSSNLQVQNFDSTTLGWRLEVESKRHWRSCTTISTRLWGFNSRQNYSLISQFLQFWKICWLILSFTCFVTHRRIHYLL